GAGAGPAGAAELALLGRGAAARAAGGLLLRRRAALLRARPGRGGIRLLPASARRTRRVGDLRRALLRHALVLERFVLLLVLDVCLLARHSGLLRNGYGPVFSTAAAAETGQRANVTLLRPRGSSGSSPRARASAQAKSWPGTTESRGARRREPRFGSGSEKEASGTAAAAEPLAISAAPASRDRRAASTTAGSVSSSETIAQTGKSGTTRG